MVGLWQKRRQLVLPTKLFRGGSGGQRGAEGADKRVATARAGRCPSRGPHRQAVSSAM